VDLQTGADLWFMNYVAPTRFVLAIWKIFEQCVSERMDRTIWTCPGLNVFGFCMREMLQKSE
jgi:hypothetical protein